MKLIKRIKIDKPEITYNLHIEKNNNYIANGIVVSNCHCSKSLSIKTILSKMKNATWRFGFTGTMSPVKLDVFNVKAYLGPIFKTFGASELADMGYISHCKVNYINFNYATKEKYIGEYNDVKEMVFNNPSRLKYIKQTLHNLDGNVLVLVGKVEKEGQLLKNYLEVENGEKEIVFIYGDTKADEREHWRLELEKRNNIILIATYQLFQLGVNIPSLKYIMFASPFKSKIRTLQSIGRTLRKHESKDHAEIYDIVDNVLFLEEHGMRRRKYYSAEMFEVDEQSIDEKIMMV